MVFGSREAQTDQEIQSELRLKHIFILATDRIRLWSNGIWSEFFFWFSGRKSILNAFQKFLRGYWIEEPPFDQRNLLLTRNVKGNFLSESHQWVWSGLVGTCPILELGTRLRSLLGSAVETDVEKGTGGDVKNYRVYSRFIVNSNFEESFLILYQALWKFFLFKSIQKTKLRVYLFEKLVSLL